MQATAFLIRTYFELLFGVAMVLFEELKAEYVVLETGLGGRLDATNTVEHPLATVITSISLDHTEILGDTIEKIAFEKAGIIKPGVPVIYDGSSPEAEKSHPCPPKSWEARLIRSILPCVKFSLSRTKAFFT